MDSPYNVVRTEHDTPTHRPRNHIDGESIPLLYFQVIFYLNSYSHICHFTFINIRTPLTRVYSATVSPYVIAFSILLVYHLGHMLNIIHVLHYFNSL
jgi:hypothetical protein